MMILARFVPLMGLFVVGWVGGSGGLNVRNMTKADFKLSSVVEVLDRVLREASAMAIETYSFAGTNVSFFQDVMDRLAWRCDRLSLPVYNNALEKHVSSRQLIIVTGDDVDDLMATLVDVFVRQTSRFFAINSRNIYVILLLSDGRFLNARKFVLLRLFFCTLNFIVLSPSPSEYGPAVLMAIDYRHRSVKLRPDDPMSVLFADRIRSQDVQPVKIHGSVSSAHLWKDVRGEVIGTDWTVFRTILEHLGLRWTLTVIREYPSLERHKQLDEQLERDVIDIYIDRGHLPSEWSVAHILPEMNGYCMVIPKAKKYEVLQHLLSPLQPACWILLGVALLVGSLLAQRYFRNGLLATFLFGANLDAPGVSRVERVVLFASLVLFYILSEAYQAKLLSLMSSQRYPPDPRTVAEFLRTDIKLEMGDTTAAVMLIRSEFAGHITNDTSYDFTYDGNTQTGVLMLCPSAWMHMLDWTRKQYARRGHNVRPAVHVVGEKILSMVATYSFSSSFVLYPRFRGLLERLFESGLIMLWQANAGHQQQYERRFEFIESTIITFGDLEAAWIALALGHATAGLVFTAELLHSVGHRCSRSFRAGRRRVNAF